MIVVAIVKKLLYDCLCDVCLCVYDFVLLCYLMFVCWVCWYDARMCAYICRTLCLACGWMIGVCGCCMVVV